MYNFVWNILDKTKAGLNDYEIQPSTCMKKNYCRMNKLRQTCYYLYLFYTNLIFFVNSVVNWYDTEAPSFKYA